MLSAFYLSNILFLDIETVPQYPSYDELPDNCKYLWNKKAEQLLRNREGDTIETVYSRAGIYAEFGKIICISCGVVSGYGDDKKLILKSFSGDDEKKLLQEFSEMLNRWATDDNMLLCAHKGKKFDFPYICRRMIINGLLIPSLLNMVGKKPWEIKHLDTMELWKFGDYKSFTSLELLAHILNIPTPKDDIDGSQVFGVYWKDKDISRIVEYCQKDVRTLAQVFLRLNVESPVKEENIEIK